MANELKCNLSLSFSKGGAKVSRSESKSIDVVGDAYMCGILRLVNDNATNLMTMPTPEAISNAGYFYLKLIGVANDGDSVQFGYAQSGDDLTNPAGKLLLGESCLLRAPTTTSIIYLEASHATGPTSVEFVVVEV